MSDAKKKKIRNRNIFMFCMLCVPVGRFVLNWALNANMFVMAFNNYEMGTAHPVFVGWDNFINVFKMFDASKLGNEWIAVRNSLTIFGLTFLVEVPLSLIFAYLIYMKMPGYKWLRIVLYMPIVMSAVVQVLMFKSFFNAGPLQSIYDFLGIGDKFPNEGWLGPNTAWTTICLYSIWAGISQNLIYFLAFMTRVPTELVEAAQLDGASEPTIFLKILLPMVSSQIGTILSLTVASLFAWGMPSLLFMGDSSGMNNTGSLGLTVINFTTAKNYGLGAAYGILLSFIATPITLSVRALSKKLSADVEY